MPTDALGRVIPGSYNPDGSVNQAVMQQYRQTALQNPGAAMRSPVAAARLTNPSPLAAQRIMQQQQMAASQPANPVSQEQQRMQRQQLRPPMSPRGLGTAMRQPGLTRP